MKYLATLAASLFIATSAQATECHVDVLKLDHYETSATQQSELTPIVGCTQEGHTVEFFRTSHYTLGAIYSHESWEWNIDGNWYVTAGLVFGYEDYPIPAPALEYRFNENSKLMIARNFVGIRVNVAKWSDF